MGYSGKYDNDDAEHDESLSRSKCSDEGREKAAEAAKDSPREI